jgi:hypothetical protein
MRMSAPVLASALGLLFAAPGCSIDSDGIGMGDDGAGDEGDDGVISTECEHIQPIVFDPGDPADLLLVVDKSGSMDQRLASGDRKWPVMRNALNAVVNQYDEGIRFGLMLYPQGNECSAGTVQSPIAPASAQAISGALAATSPDGGTPTHTTLTVARSYLQGVQSPGARYVLLATDGEPNCGNPNDFQQPTVTESVAAIQALRQDGISTFVLGFGGTVNNEPATLQAMAQAGGTGDYFAANSPAELSTALDAIAGEVGLPSCSIRLDRTPRDEGALLVYQDGDLVPRDRSQQDGWDYNPATNTVSFYGAACDAIRAGRVSQVRIELGCNSGDVVD